MSKMVGLWNWIDKRLPVQRAWDTHMGKYYAPKNFNFWYFFGVLSLLVLVNQLVTGIWLTMNYVPSPDDAFRSVEYIMRDVEYGWLLRYLHSTGASAFFVVVYLHMFRGLMYGSYKAPRELVWIFGMTIYVVLMAEAFLGYVLPWGQMSYWGAQVIVSLFGAIPVVGEDLVQWIRGDYLISGITLNRFFALHVVALPIVLLALVVLHILALHEVGSNNPDGIDIKANKDENGIPKDGVPFHPYYTVHDLTGIAVFLFVFCFIVFFFPEMGGFFLEHPNFEEANNLMTPEHIAPVWYFTPFYAILRAITVDVGPLDSRFLGLMAMGAAIAVLFVLPWLDRSPVRSMRYKGMFSRVALIVFVSAFVILGYLGVQPSTAGRTALAQICTLIYFAYFIGMPFWTTREKTSPVPDRVQKKGLPLRLTLGGLALFAVLVVVPIAAVGAGAPSCGDVPCDVMKTDPRNKDSLQRGAKWYMNYCMGCHSVKFSRYERVADDLDIPHDLMRDNMIFSTHRIGERMEISMSTQDGAAWFGVAPPDLSLVARSRSPEWLYTYLRNFYRDDSRPFGVNNRVFSNVGMPHAMLELQGLLECGAGPERDQRGNVVRDGAGNPVIDENCGNLVEGAISGSMSQDEFDQVTYDLVNFLAYVAEPYKVDRQRIGIYVLLFILVFFVFAYLLNREYWKDIH
ncbi:ubiquinol-cytochrome c reductase [Marinimicrobium alkaliphilum]|uniref:ubiquinol-cytochrome c reductase n=1 Tax=Marinimicrobium alkaliphilum TaxID=2202654 RepID=UPI000DB92A67|nr:cytochrome b N-terminal domain-containing protein [Marinimicrobium alkaliphilum]